MLHQIFNDFILFAMLLTNDVIDLLPQQLRNYQLLNLVSCINVMKSTNTSSFMLSQPLKCRHFSFGNCNISVLCCLEMLSRVCHTVCYTEYKILTDGNK